MAACLDRVLELCARRRLSIAELRVLLALADGEASRAELAEQLAVSPVDLRRATRRLVARGFVRRRHSGPSKQMRVGLTSHGLATTRALVSAASGRPDRIRANGH